MMKKKNAVYGKVCVWEVGWRWGGGGGGGEKQCENKRKKRS